MNARFMDCRVRFSTVRSRVLLAGLLLVACCVPALARYSDSERRAIEAVRKVKPSVVRIDTSCPGAIRGGVGSGVVLRSDGFILTNHHVIRYARTIRVTVYPNRVYQASVWADSPAYDLAVLKINALHLPVPHFGNSAHLQLGQMAISIGAPERFSWSVSVGTVSAIGRQITTRGVVYHDLIQTDAAINPGSSGGALVDSSGDVIGINTLVFTGTNPDHPVQGLGFALAINDALHVAEGLVARRPIAPPLAGRAWLGIDGKTLTYDMAQMNSFRVRSGVLVTGVPPGSPAARVGICRDDVITQLGTAQVGNIADLKRALSACHAGEVVRIVFWTRGRARRVVNLQLADAPP